MLIAVLSTRRRKQVARRPRLAENYLTYVGNFIYFAVHFDEKLNYKIHMDYVVNKCSKRTNLLKMLSRVTWDVPKDRLLVVYRLIIRLVIEYETEAYFAAPETRLRKNEVIKNKAHHKPVVVPCAVPDCNDTSLSIRHILRNFDTN